MRIANGTSFRNSCCRAFVVCCCFLLSVGIDCVSQTKAFSLSTHFTTLDVGEQAPGLGATFGYMLNRRIELESTLNFYPGNPQTNLGKSNVPLGDLKTGNILQGQFGVRANAVHFKRIDFFLKAKPGFVSFSDIAYAFQAGLGGAGVSGLSWSVGRQTGFALDVGGGFEFSAGHNAFIRFDAGDTYFQYPTISTIAALPGTGIAPVITIPGSSVNTFQFSAGVGFRFGGTK